jgi:prepilin-type N-terminal cleavage/methylation domain-containing protein
MDKFFLTKSRRINPGFTLIELLIVIAIIALLMAILVPALSRAKEMGKRAVCLTQIKQLQLAWNMYADDNDDKIPAGDVAYSWSFHTGGQRDELAWHEWPHPFPHAMPPSVATNGLPDVGGAAYPADCVITGKCKQPEWEHAIAEGLLWKYIKDYKAYQCPVGEKGHFVTYSNVHSIHTWIAPGWSPPQGSAGTKSVALTILKKSQIKRASDRVVFIDAGQAQQAASYLPYDRYGGLTYVFPPPARHGMGTTFSYADGHSAYKKWKDPHTLKVIKERKWDPTDIDNCDCDLRWYCRAVWGDIPDGYDCKQTPPKRCDEF